MDKGDALVNLIKKAKLGTNIEVLLKNQAENPSNMPRMSSMIDQPAKVAHLLDKFGPKTFHKNLEMQLLRPYCDKLEESRLYDIHNLNGIAHALHSMIHKHAHEMSMDGINTRSHCGQSAHTTGTHERWHTVRTSLVAHKSNAS